MAEALGIASSIIAVVDLSAKVLSLCLQYSREVKNAKDDIDRLHDEVAAFQNTTEKLEALLKEPPRLSVILQNVDDRTILSQLPAAEGASFDSHAEEHNPTCLPNTREELLKEIDCWIDDPKSKTIFWLNGKAGTGKSTISRTVARSRSKQGDLGASFFSREERSAVNADPAIADKAVREQFEKLVREPLLKATATSLSRPSVFIVVDALDECEKDADIKLILQLFSNLRFAGPLCVRVLVTSRPELPIRLGFSSIGNAHQDLILHKIPLPIIEHDISVFLRHEFANIRNNFNTDAVEELKLPMDWPGEANVGKLTKAAVPLFIFAATLCRFINDRYIGSPDELLQSVLNVAGTGQGSKLDMTYSPVLRQQVLHRSGSERLDIIESFRLIVGTIVTLANPLSMRALALLLDVHVSKVTTRLSALHSVLDIPETLDAPVRLLHLSFRDYLVGLEERELAEFRVEERHTHQILAKHCLRIMRGGLQKNICSLPFPGMRRSSVDFGQLEKRMPSQLQYACMHWAYHQTSGEPKLSDDKDVYGFLTTHFLHWLEAMSLLGRVKECLDTLRLLARWVETLEGSSLSTFVADAERFVQAYFSVAAETPLQIYCCLAFVPRKSVVRRTFENFIPKWISNLPKVEENWDACLLTLEGHSSWVRSVVFSHDSKKVASGSDDETIRIWDAETGECERELKGHSSYIRSVVFSHDSKKVASGSADKTIRIWNAETGECERELKGHSSYIRSVVFSHDSKKVASGSADKTIRIWNAETGECERELKGHSSYINSVVFSHDSKKVASGSDDETIRIWNAETGECERELKGHIGYISSVVFSHDSKKVASGSDDETIRIWNAETGECERELKGHIGDVNSVVFSHDSKKVASGSYDETIRIWNAETGECERELKGHIGYISSVVFSHDSKKVASGSYDETIRIWNAETGECERELKGHTGYIRSVVFSHDSKKVASCSHDETIRIWNAETGECERELKGHISYINSVVFSHDSKKVASCSHDETIRIWNAETGECERELKGHIGDVNSVVFSHDSKKVASGSDDETIRIWNAETGECERELKGHIGDVNSVVFSHDSKKVASGSYDETIRIWNAETGECERELKGHIGYISSVVFSHDSKKVASGSYDETIRIWNAETGECERELKGHTGYIRSVVFSHDSKKVASCSHDETIRIWNAETGECERELKGHSSYINSVVFSHDSKKVASCSHDETIRIWNAETGECERELKGHIGDVNSVVFSHDSKKVASGSDDETIRIWNAETGECERELKGHSSYINSVVFSHDSKKVASGSDDETIRIWNAETGECGDLVSLHGYAGVLSFTLDGRGIVTDCGTFPLTCSSQSRPGSAMPWQSSHAPMLACTDSTWVTAAGKDLLWLPPECRGGKVAVSGSRVFTTFGFFPD
ncbi:uncharacterized protein FPOAC1_012889 [Fusarium poae]|uniref:uncharacterized protein n=1 Tax=Fusarium poae TaxID=36050 RepID=UPI001D04F5E2|nr:uncharacterized protein FPOAC1_012889 [Fusarium poae]KAG8664912.1 hypothetical protein FPOAC1_012889 [Fusarium poae]